MDGEATVIAHNVSVSSTTILSILNDMGFDIVTSSPVDTQRIESPWMLSYIHRAFRHLMSRLVSDCESSVVIGDVGIAVVAALPKSLLVSSSFIDESRFVMSRTMHLFMKFIL